MRTQVAIIGAGPAGLTLSRILHLHGIESVIVESHSRSYIEQRVRAGVLEDGTMELLNSIGVGARMMREGMQHQGIELRFENQAHRIDFAALTGKGIIVYGQQEIVKDLVAAHLAESRPILFEVSAVTLSNIESGPPQVRFRHEGAEHVLTCDYIAGCDGFHGISRQSIPASALKLFEHKYPFGWLGILAEAAPSTSELVYAAHDRGFALHSMRSPKLVRNYLQCEPDEDVKNWPDDRIWDELQQRMELAGGFSLHEGSIIEKSVTPMRSFVVEPMQYGRLFLAGDSAHIVPPTGAKGMNLALKDVSVLAEALVARYEKGVAGKLQAYSESCLRHVWKAQVFSSWMTSILHRFDTHDDFQRKLQLTRLRNITESRAGSTYLAEGYIGL
jgi:p-hydroxybenzoate 3-monooxygenase